MRKILPLFLFVFVILLAGFASAAPPSFLTSIGEETYQIYVTGLSSEVQQGTELRLHIHVENFTTSFPIYNTQVGCYAHAYNSSNDHSYEMERALPKNGVFDHELILSEGNTSDLGSHEIRVWCNSSSFAGVETIYFEVTPTGETQNNILENPLVLILILLAILMVIVGINYKVPAVGFLGAILFILAGMYTLIYGFNNLTNLYTRASGVTIIALGFFFMFVSAFEWFKNEEY